MVTALAWRMVTHWGMGKQVGTVFADDCEPDSVGITNSTAYAVPAPPRYISSDTMATLIDSEVQGILHEG